MADGIQWPIIKEGTGRGADRSKTVNVEQEALKAQLQAVTQRLESKVAALTEQESRLLASLKGKYGAKNEALEAFGIKPPKAPMRKKVVG